MPWSPPFTIDYGLQRFAWARSIALPRFGLAETQEGSLSWFAEPPNVLNSVAAPGESDRPGKLDQPNHDTGRCAKRLVASTGVMKWTPPGASFRSIGIEVP